MAERLLQGLPGVAGRWRPGARGVLDAGGRRGAAPLPRPSARAALAAARAALGGRGRRSSRRSAARLRADGRATRPRSSRPAC